MLILSRNFGEKIYIGDNIFVQVVGIQGGRVKLGVEAPDEVEIHRDYPHHYPQSDERPEPRDDEPSANFEYEGPTP